MQQGQLLACIDCGKSLHISADVCPACNSRAPQGMTCRICGTRDSSRRLISMRFSRYGEPDSDWSAVAHSACMRRLGMPERCTTCNVVFDDAALQTMLTYVPFGTFGIGLSFPPEDFRCSSCRAPNPLQIVTACNHCWCPISEAARVQRGNTSFHADCEVKKKSQNPGCLGVLSSWLA